MTDSEGAQDINRDSVNGRRSTSAAHASPGYFHPHSGDHLDVVLAWDVPGPTGLGALIRCRRCAGQGRLGGRPSAPVETCPACGGEGRQHRPYPPQMLVHGPGVASDYGTPPPPPASPPAATGGVVDRRKVRIHVDERAPVEDLAGALWETILREQNRREGQA